MSDATTYFYYSSGQRVPLELVEDTVAVAFNEPISERRLEELRANDRTIDILGQSKALLSRNVLIYRTTAAHGPERLRDFAERLSRGQSVRFVTFVFRDPEQDLYLIMIDEIVARFRPDVSQEQIDALNDEH